MNWKFTADRPVYQQIMALIRGAILRGELPPGGSSPRRTAPRMFSMICWYTGRSPENFQFIGTSSVLLY